MYGFGHSIAVFWWIAPVAVAIIAAPLVRRLIGKATGEAGIAEQKPAALVSSSDATIFRLAKRLNGRLTVSDVAVGTGMGSGESEALLQRMVDGTRVRMEVERNGTVIYELTELWKNDGPSSDEHRSS